MEDRAAPVDGDPAAVNAITTFLNAWFVRNDYRKAISFVAPQARLCGEGEERDRGEDGFRRAARLTRKGNTIAAVVSSAESWNPAMRAVRHANGSAFSIYLVPSELAAGYRCPAGIDGNRPGVCRDFSDAHAGRSAVLLTLWEQDTGAWSMTAWAAEAP